MRCWSLDPVELNRLLEEWFNEEPEEEIGMPIYPRVDLLRRARGGLYTCIDEYQAVIVPGDLEVFMTDYGCGEFYLGEFRKIAVRSVDISSAKGFLKLLIDEQRSIPSSFTRVLTGVPVKMYEAPDEVKTTYFYIPDYKTLVMEFDTVISIVKPVYVDFIGRGTETFYTTKEVINKIENILDSLRIIRTEKFY